MVYVLSDIDPTYSMAWRTASHSNFVSEIDPSEVCLRALLLGFRLAMVCLQMSGR